MIGVLSLLFAACNGNDRPDAASAAHEVVPATRTAAATTERKYIVAEYGDSTTYGSQTINGKFRYTERSEPVVLQELLRERFGDRVVVEKHAVGGTEAAQIYRGEGGYPWPWKREMEISKADIVTINYGLNDSFFNAKPKAGVPNTDAVEYARILTAMVNEARAAGKHVVLYTPNPTRWQPSRGNIYDYVEAVKNIGYRMGVPVVDKFYGFQARENWRALLSDDGVHPNDAGYRVAAEMQMPAIAGIIEALDLH
ncbi:SGNH/GDSL hydrolase family protein [Burkholderia cepacia]